MGLREWKRIHTGTTETLARIRGDDLERKNTTSLGEGFEVRKPSTLVLQNVDEDYDGRYQFSIVTKDFKVDLDSDVTVLVLSKYFYNCLLFTVLICLRMFYDKIQLFNIFLLLKLQITQSLKVFVINLSLLASTM